MPSGRLKRTVDHPDVKHGTYVTYMNYRCRCDDCVADYRRYRSEYRSKNRERIAESSAAYYVKNRDRLREQDRKRSTSDEGRTRRKAAKFGLTVEALRRLLATNECAICGTNDPGKHGWHIDHDHSCCPAPGPNLCGKCVRGLLCHKCNVGLGHFDDDRERLLKAVNYLADFQNP